MSGTLHISPRHLALSGALALTLIMASIGGITPAAAAAMAEQSFPTPDAAAAALTTALLSGDETQRLSVLGADAKRLLSSGDAVADQNARKSFLAAYAAKHTLEQQGDARVVLVIGDNDWPFPIPIVRAGNAWQFDSAAGAQELINRRIGRNELSTIRTLLEVVAAQKDYFERSKAGGREGTYARHFTSAKDKTDGLYWVPKPGEPDSPLAKTVLDAESEGYPSATDRGRRPQPYHGYLFQMLTAQGPEAPGGQRNYMVQGQLTGGFAMLAWPAQYDNSGIVSFQVDQDGIVFQKDLGPGTAPTAARISRFDPDDTWARVDLKDE
jgi:hypothetical protein